MILCLDIQILPHMHNFLELLIEHCTSDDILDVAQLLNQTCSKFKKESIQCVDKAILPFLKKCQNFLPNSQQLMNENGKQAPHLITEQHAILKIIYGFLFQVVSTQCTQVLLSSTNISSLEHILNTMNKGAQLVPDPLMKKTCVQFFRALVNQWLVAECNLPEITRIQKGFCQFLFKTFLPGMFECLADKDFNEKDAMQYRVVREVAVVLLDIKTNCGNNEFDEFFSELNAPTEVIQRFHQAKSSVEMEMWLNGMMGNKK